MVSGGSEKIGRMITRIVTPNKAMRTRMPVFLLRRSIARPPLLLGLHTDIQNFQKVARRRIEDTS
jgi:hypothetical protein